MWISLTTITQLCPSNRAALERETAELQTNQNRKVELTASVGRFWSLLLTACKRNDVLL